MKIETEAIYKNGVLRPAGPLGLAEDVRVHLKIEVRVAGASPGDDEDGWSEVDELVALLEEGTEGPGRR